MARTDKDTPAWVRRFRAAGRSPRHSWRCAQHGRYGSRGGPLTHPCDLPEDLTWGLTRCSWTDPDEPSWGPDRDDRRVYFHGPQRRRARDELRDLARAYNAGLEPDDLDEPTLVRARHSLDWLD